MTIAYLTCYLVCKVWRNICCLEAESVLRIRIVIKWLLPLLRIRIQLWFWMVSRGGSKTNSDTNSVWTMIGFLVPVSAKMECGGQNYRELDRFRIRNTKSNLETKQRKNYMKKRQKHIIFVHIIKKCLLFILSFMLFVFLWLAKIKYLNF